MKYLACAFVTIAWPFAWFGAEFLIGEATFRTNPEFRSSLDLALPGFFIVSYLFVIGTIFPRKTK